MPATLTPIRYPGGKTKIYPIVKSILLRNGLAGCAYAEVFAGGAGLAIKLLLNGDVSSITINDYDRAVFCMWDAIVNHADEMCDFVDSATLNPETWLMHRETYRNRDQVDALELGKASFYLNRTNVSGILSGGLIGGLEQLGNFKMDVRFSRDTLKKKIRAIADKGSVITVTCQDAETFIDSCLASDETFAYFDPPYVQKGPGLYRSSFDEAKHRALADAISKCQCKWVVTYDDDRLVEELYGGYQQNDIAISYTANVKTIGKEKMILGPGLVWPDNAD